MSSDPQPSASGSRSGSPTGDPNAALLRSAYAADMAGVIDALKQGADVNAADPVTGLTALHIAVGTNNLVLTRILVEDWHAVFKPDGRGRWPTLIAVQVRVDDVLADYIVEAEAKALDTA